MTAKEIREKRAVALGKIKALRDLLTGDKTAFNAEEKGQWEACNTDYDALTAQLDIVERTERLEADQRSEAEQRRRMTIPGREDTDSRDSRDGVVTEERRTQALSAWCRSQMGSRLSENDREALIDCRMDGCSQLEIPLLPTESRRQLQERFRSVHHSRAGQACRELRLAMNPGIAAQGGALVPETMVQRLEINMLAFGGMRQVAEIMTTATGERMAWPTADDTSNTGEQLGDNADNSNSGAGVSPSFGQVFWDAYNFSSKMILVPYSLLQDSGFNLPVVLGDLLGERLGRITNTKYTTGTGAGTARGITLAAGTGVTTASATAFTWDEIIALEHSVDPAYRIGAGYMFHDSILLAARLLKDGSGRYLWQDNANSGVPATFNGKPYTVNQDMASSVIASAITMAFGQLSQYKIRSVGAMRFYRLTERYRDKDQDGFIAFLREDGNLLNAGTNPVKLLVQHS